ncbi:MFS transporter [Microbispora sp. GKU 823]|uniref:MFS transporter n=1 Tax=Microbispora sp. GKU 823 TaxID=1652100 RepID=UPI0009A4407F|nr:MFS transporter [Microbispora sp. GKU 823]
MITAVRVPAIARDRHFLALWTAHSVSTLGDALTTLTLILLITERTHSVAAVGGLTVIIAVPSIVIGLVSGVYVDRHNRRRTMIVADASRAVLLAALAILTLASPALPALYLIALLQASVGTFFNPARAGLMQMIVPADEQVRANSLIQTTTVIDELVGTTLAGVLVASSHTYWIAFTIDAATFALSGVLIATIRGIHSPPPEQRQTTWTAIVDGMRAVRSSPALRALLLVFGALTFALSPMAVLLAPYIVDTLHLSTGWIGVIQAGDTAGNIVGGTLAAVTARHLKPRGLIIAGMMTLAALIASLTWATTVAALLIAYVVFGLLTVTIQTGIGALTQTEVDNALMGRFIGLMSITPGAISVLAMTFVGSLGAAVGIRTVFLISGGSLALGTTLAWRQFHRATRQGAQPRARERRPLT